MKKVSLSTRNFILDNIKINKTVSYYPLCTVAHPPQKPIEQTTQNSSTECV